MLTFPCPGWVDPTNNMLRHLANAILALASLFMLGVIWLYLRYDVTDRTFWACFVATVGLFVTGMVVYRTWAHRAAQRDDVKAFEVITHDDDDA